MSDKGRQIRGVLALCGAAALLAALGKMPATFSAYSAIERGEGPAIVAANYDLAAEMAQGRAEQIVTATVDELVRGTTSDGTPMNLTEGYSWDVIQAATAQMAEVGASSETVSCATVTLTLTVVGDTTGYLAMHYADGPYYSGVLAPGEYVTLTLPAGSYIVSGTQTAESYAEQVTRNDRVSVYVMTENGEQQWLLDAEACWGTPPDTAAPVNSINTGSEEVGAAVTAAGSIFALQEKLDGVIGEQLRTLADAKHAELLGELQQELQSALERQKQAEQERLDAEEAERAAQEADQAAGTPQEGAGAGTDVGTGDGTGSAQEDPSFGMGPEE